MSYIQSTSATVALTSTLISPEQGSKYTGIQNRDAANPIAIHFGNGDAVFATGILLLAGEYLSIPVPTGQEIKAIATGAPVVVALVR